MYIHREAKLIFLAQPRTASRSVANGLKEHGFEMFGHHPLPGFIDPSGLPLDLDTRNVIRSDRRDSYSVASAVRNPFDVLVSWYFHMQNIGKCLDLPFGKRFVCALWDDQPQYFEPGKMYGRYAPLSDTIFRYEYIETALNTWLTFNNLNTVTLHPEGATGHEHYRHYYDDDMRAWVEREYADELTRWGYSFWNQKTC